MTARADIGLRAVHHVGYVARSCTTAASDLIDALGLRLTREFEFPDFSLRGIFLSTGDSLLEIIEFTDPAIADQRLEGAELRLDHVAYEVLDIERAVSRLRASGVRLCRPDGVSVDGPIAVAGARHVWTMPSSAVGIALQLIEPAVMAGDASGEDRRRAR